MPNNYDIFSPMSPTTSLILEGYIGYVRTHQKGTSYQGRILLGDDICVELAR